MSNIAYSLSSLFFFSYWIAEDNFKSSSVAFKISNFSLLFSLCSDRRPLARWIHFLYRRRALVSHFLNRRLDSQWPHFLSYLLLLSRFLLGLFYLQLLLLVYFLLLFLFISRYQLRLSISGQEYIFLFILVQILILYLIFLLQLIFKV